MIAFNKTRMIGALAVAMGLAVPQAAQAAQGLNGFWYDTGAITSLAQAESVISGLTPDATFRATTVCYPYCHGVMNDSSSLNSFLGSNATDISPNSISNLSGHVMVLEGYINIAADGIYALGLGSDDGSSLTIDGTTLSNDGLHAYSFLQQNFSLTAGYHPIRIVQFEYGGYTGLTAKLNLVPLHDVIVTTPPAVPEPASWALMIGGLGLTGAAMRRRARPAVAAA